MQKGEEEEEEEEAAAAAADSQLSRDRPIKPLFFRAEMQLHGGTECLLGKSASTHTD